MNSMKTTVKKVQAGWHPGNIVEACIHALQYGTATQGAMLERLVEYRQERFNPYPDMSLHHWMAYLLASEFAARAFDLEF